MSQYLLNFIIFFVLLAVVGGVYYWFVVGKNQPQATPAVATTTQGTSTVASTTTIGEQSSAGLIDGPSGLKYQILKVGTGQEAKNGNDVLVHYVGTLEDGTKFDSSRDRNKPFDFVLGTGAVIKGWDLGVLGMKVGEIRKLIIPSSIGYGAQGQGPIPPNATLIFEVELLGVSGS
ncbi:MAG: FKBP-type peptidyl-prolyl cis-trans isomerase [Candidatus Gribaldobacteria bacterium]|nr:FKBP-type peptidyl-prolyl cis-trans isomerase [Candidatus Gribaldobacteria bacterium]